MADEPKLIVAVEARLDRFERQLKQAGLIAERELKELENKTKGFTIGGVAAGNLLAIGIEKAMSAAVDAISKAIDEMNKLNDVLERTGITAEQFQRVAFAGMAGGLKTADLLAGLEAAGAKLDEINRRENELSKLLDANGIKYKERNGLVVDVNRGLELAAQLMAKAGSEFEKIEIARTFGLTAEWVKVLGEGVEKFRQMKDAARIDPELARSLQSMEALSKLANQISADIKAWGTGLVVSVLPPLQTTLELLQPIYETLNEIARGSFLEANAERGLARFQRILDLVREARKEAEGPLRITVNKPSGVKWPAAAPTGEADALTKQFEQLAKLKAVREAELATIGMTVAKQEEARQLALLTEAAKRAEVTVDAEILAKMQEQAKAAGEITQKLVERNAKWAEMVSSSRELGSIMSDAMKSMVLEGKKFDEVLKNIGNRLASKAFDQAFDLLFKAPAGGGGSVAMNLLAGLFKGGKMAGGPVRGGSAYMVGERGPELFVPGRSGMVVPNTALSNGSGAAVAPVSNTVVNIAGSADRETLALMQSMLAARDRRFVADVAHATAELRRRSAFA